MILPTMASPDMHPAHESACPSGWQRILVVIDPTASRQPALDKAARIATLTGGTLELYACDDQYLVPPGWAETAEQSHAYRELVRARVLSDLEALAQPLRDQGLTVATQYEWHAPLEEGVGRHAIRSGADLVVKETHHHSLMYEAQLSRTDWNLIRQVPVPLLLVRPARWPTSPRIAAAVDPLHPADRPVALDEQLSATGRQLADLLQGTLQLMHVVQPPPHLPGEYVTREHRDAASAQAHQAIEPLALQANAPVLYEQGQICDGLLRLAKAQAIDILLMGATARPRSTHAIAGGTAARILERTDCDLLVMKPPGFISPLLVTFD